MLLAGILRKQRDSR